MALDPPDDAHPAPDPGLAALGLVPGDRVALARPYSRVGARGGSSSRERYGSVAVRDERGRAGRSVTSASRWPPRGPRGAATWEPVAAGVARTEQLGLWGRAPSGPPVRHGERADDRCV